LNGGEFFDVIMRFFLGFFGEILLYDFMGFCGKSSSPIVKRIFFFYKISDADFSKSFLTGLFKLSDWVTSIAVESQKRANFGMGQVRNFAKKNK
jgi:hypothetical protein